MRRSLGASSCARSATKGVQIGVRVERGTSPERGRPHPSGRRNKPAGRGPRARPESVERVLTRHRPGVRSPDPPGRVHAAVQELAVTQRFSEPQGPLHGRVARA